MNVLEFVEGFKNDKVINTQIKPNAVSEYIKEKLEIKIYLPFRMKRTLVETVVSQNVEWVDGLKRIDSINEYVGFIVAVLSAHTNLEFADDPVTDYDLLAESGLLPQIIAEFQESYSECEVLLKMARAAELEDNNINAIVARFTDGILQKLDGVGEVLKDKLGNIDVKDILGGAFKQEDLVKLKGFLDRYNK